MRLRHARFPVSIACFGTFSEARSWSITEQSKNDSVKNVYNNKGGSTYPDSLGEHDEDTHDDTAILGSVAKSLEKSKLKKATNVSKTTPQITCSLLRGSCLTEAEFPDGSSGVHYPGWVWL